MNDIISSRSCDSGHRTAYSITSSAVTPALAEISIPSAFAVLS
jgi:hypothetical protein